MHEEWAEKSRPQELSSMHEARTAYMACIRRSPDPVWQLVIVRPEQPQHALDVKEKEEEREHAVTGGA